MLAIGQDPTDPSLTARLERLLHGLGRAGPVVHAISGLDIALWDIRGKLEGVSVSKLLGGAKRKRVETYASLLQYGGVVEHVQRNTARALERGYRHIKLHERTAEAVAAARDVAGPDIPIMVDTNCAWTAGQADAPVAAMAPSKPFWVEEPIWPPEDFESLAELAQGNRRAAGDGRERHRRARLPQDDCRRRDRFRAAERRQDRRPDQPVAGRDRGREGRRHLRAARVLLRAGLSRDAACHRLPRSATAPLERLFARRRLHRLCEDRARWSNGAVEVPDRPGLGADPEEEMIDRFRV